MGPRCLAQGHRSRMSEGCRGWAVLNRNPPRQQAAILTTFAQEIG